MIRRSRSFFLVAAVAFAGVPALAAKKTELEVKPGPAVMSEAERAIAPDAAAGAQHAVILDEETDRNDNERYGYAISYHLRAKILSADGRTLADVEIPVPSGLSDLKTWWGRTILPDGTSVELPKESLTVATVAKTAFGSAKELKGALPGVVPGCVIDYGYVVRRDGFPALERIVLQRDWPVRSLKFHWMPSDQFPAAYVSQHTEGRDIKITRDSLSVLVTGTNVPAVKDEPYAPPKNELRATFDVYYADDRTPDEFWTLEGKAVDSGLRLFTTGGAIKDALASMGLPDGAPLQDKLRAAYDWIARNIKNTYLQSAEEDEAAERTNKETYNAATVLRAREGTPRQLDYLFAGMARALGAEAQIVFTTDRTDRFWNFGLKSLGQFAYSFVAVRAPGQGDDAWTIVDAGSGLPYGQVPWEATGTTGCMCTSKGWAKLVVPPASTAQNRSDTRVALSFSDDGETILAKWSRTAQGASGMDTRRFLRDLDPQERKKELDRLCRGEGGAEVVSADLPGLDDPTAPHRIACDVEVGESNLTEDIGHYSFSLMGAWWPPMPELNDANRTYPVILSYPQGDVLSIDLKAPPGFVPKQPPRPVDLTSNYGRYHFAIAATATGYHVDRVFELTPLIVRPPEYPALKEFLDKVHQTDRTAVVFDRTGARP